MNIWDDIANAKAKQAQEKSITDAAGEYLADASAQKNIANVDELDAISAVIGTATVQELSVAESTATNLTVTGNTTASNINMNGFILTVSENQGLVLDYTSLGYKRAAIMKVFGLELCTVAYPGAMINLCRSKKNDVTTILTQDDVDILEITDVGEAITFPAADAGFNYGSDTNRYAQMHAVTAKFDALYEGIAIGEPSDNEFTRNGLAKRFTDDDFTTIKVKIKKPDGSFVILTEAS